MQGKEQLNIWNFKDYIRNILMILAKIPIWVFQVCLFWIPIQKNRIIIYSLKQHGYSCNLKYLTEYLKAMKKDVFQILWIVKREEDYHLLKERGIPVVMLHSKEHFLYRMRAGIVITNDEFYPMFLKRKGQLYINTWHGGINYKKIGYAGLEFTNPIQKMIYKMNNPCPDLFISGSRSFTETTSGSFGFPEKIFLSSGLLRNDILCKPKDRKQIADIKEKIGITANKKVLLYAPTFRKGNHVPREKLDFVGVTRKLQEKFGGEWIVLLRQHYFISNSEMEKNEKVIDVSQYEDMQELILCSDCMISDYSSCMWDYIVTGNPCFVYAEDLNEYMNEDRSFFIPIEEWPYPLCRNMKELYDAIENFDREIYEKNIKVHREKFGSYDRGVACEQLVNKLEQYIKN